MKEKGFTLIELLAVILILGIIALIAIPTVTNIIEESKRGAFKTTVQNLMDAVEKKCTTDMLNGKELVTTYTITDGKITPNVEIKGKLPSSGTINMSDECLVNNVNLTDDTYIAQLKNDKVVVRNLNNVLNVYKPGDIVYYNPVDNVKCSEEAALNNKNSNGSVTGITSGCMKWYVITANDHDESKTIDVILDHNTRAFAKWGDRGSTYDTSYIKDKVEKLDDSVESGGSGWINGLNPRLISADEVAKIVGADKLDALKWKADKIYKKASELTDLNTEISWFYFDGEKNLNKISYSSTDGWQKQYANATTKSDYYWLYDNLYNCKNYGCKIQDNNKYEYASDTDARNIYGYWTSTLVLGVTDAWVVSSIGKMNYEYGMQTEHVRGIRPVITISKYIIL